MLSWPLSRRFRPLAAAVAVAALAGCAADDEAAPPPEARKDVEVKVDFNAPDNMVIVVEPDRLPIRIPADQLPVHMFRDIVDRTGKELAAIENIADEGRKAVIRLGPFHNQTSLALDSRMFLESIRAAAIKHSDARILFRDDRAYPAILDERARLAKPETGVAVFGRADAARADGGADVSGARARMDYSRSVGVDGQLAEATHILTGSLFQMQERADVKPTFGANYLQYHFRLVDQSNGVIVWHRAFQTKVLGRLADLPEPVAAVAGTGSGGFVNRAPF